ncbi:hypothetical protein [Virgibacillus ihumii]|uniref:hypothetical protein n=1 Tax=Virgibacillus ihumii TaxID=2686091 RepID=UPI00157D567B|nr:hypothetical protein [Virgibacillus ihumii]
MKTKHRSYFKKIFSIALILPLLFMIQAANLQTEAAGKSGDDHKISKTSIEKVQAFQKFESKSSSKKKDREVINKTISHDTIVTLTNGFMDVLIQDLNKHNKVVHFNTKEALLDEFEKVTTREVASKYVDFYFKEKPDGLYVIPTETPFWFQEKNNYDMIRKDENVVQIVQRNKNELYRAYTIKIEFTYKNNWKITNILHK